MYAQTVSQVHRCGANVCSAGTHRRYVGQGTSHLKTASLCVLVAICSETSTRRCRRRPIACNAQRTRNVTSEF